MGELLLPPGFNRNANEAQEDEKFTKEITAVLNKYRVLAFVAAYTLPADKHRGIKSLLAGQAPVQWYDKAWQLIRSQTSKLYTRDILKNKRT